MGTLALTQSSNFAVHDQSLQHDLQVMLGLAIFKPCDRILFVISVTSAFIIATYYTCRYIQHQCSLPPTKASNQMVETFPGAGC